jgi:hypothetical protein
MRLMLRHVIALLISLTATGCCRIARVRYSQPPDQSWTGRVVMIPVYENDHGNPGRAHEAVGLYMIEGPPVRTEFMKHLTEEPSLLIGPDQLVFTPATFKSGSVIHVKGHFFGQVSPMLPDGSSFAWTIPQRRVFQVAAPDRTKAP